MPTGQLAPLLETLRQRDAPFEIPHFPRSCIYKLQKCSLQCPLRKMQKKACAGAWHRLPFGREYRKETGVSSAFPQSAAAGTRVGAGRKLNIAKHGMVLSENPPVLFLYAFVLPIFCRSAASAGYTDTPDNQKHRSRLSFSNQSNSRR